LFHSHWYDILICQNHILSYPTIGGILSYICRLDISVAAQRMRDELEWDEHQKGLVLSAFFWGYSVGQIPASLLASRIGSKFCFGFSVIVPCILTLLVPIASRTSFHGALLIRVLIGLTAAGTYPSAYNFFPQWLPVKEKTVLISVAYSGVYLVHPSHFFHPLQSRFSFTTSNSPYCTWWLLLVG
jgi:MFS family permease